MGVAPDRTACGWEEMQRAGAIGGRIRSSLVSWEGAMGVRRNARANQRRLFLRNNFCIIFFKNTPFNSLKNVRAT